MLNAPILHYFQCLDFHPPLEDFRNKTFFEHNLDSKTKNSGTL
jgi:hypothetical protein